MTWSRYIKRTAVRRVVWIVVGLIVYALFGLFTEASAQDVCGFPRIHDAATAAGGGQTYASQGEAYQACMSVAQEVWVSSSSGVSRFGEFQECRLNANGTAYVAWFMDSHQRYSSCEVHPNPPNNPQERRSNPTWLFTGNCAARSRIEFNTNVSLHGPPPIYMCDRGCEFIKTADLPGQFCGLVEEGPNVGYWCNSEYTATGSTCTGDGDGTAPGEGSEPPPTDPDAPPRACGVGEVRLPNGECSPRGDCPLGQHKVGEECHPVGKCPVGHVKAPDGSCAPESCPANYVRGMDGTCKVDSNDDGTPDEDEPGGDGDNPDGKKFSGGDSCSVPPACSGDAIMCGQARIQWRIDCNTRTASGATGGDHCDSFNMPICIGEHCDPVEQKQMIIQWRSMCALESLVNQEGDGDEGGTATIDVGAIGEGAVDGASGTIGDGGDPGEAFSDGSEGGQGDGELDTGGLGFGTACPALPSINVLGVTLDFNEIGPELCDWMSLGGYIVLILSSLLSLRILAGGMNV